LRIFYTGRFKKDYKRVKKQGRPLNEIKTVVEKLAGGQVLPASYKDHCLLGKWKNHRECHICGEEGNAHSPPDIHYSKKPAKDKRLTRRPSPSQEPPGKAQADATENNSSGGELRVNFI